MTETKQVALREAVNLAMTEEMWKDDMIFPMGGDIGIYGGDFGTSVGIFEGFGPERTRGTPTPEATTAGSTISTAVTGFRLIIDVTFMDFITTTLDVIINNDAKNNYMFGGGLRTPVAFRVVSGPGIGSTVQYLQSLGVWLIHIPGIKVVAPGNTNDTKGLLKPTIRDNNIAIFMGPEALYGKKKEVNLNSDFHLPLEKGDIKREGTDLTIVSYDCVLERVPQAVGEVAAGDTNVEVVDLRVLIPLDKELAINSVKKTGKLMLVNGVYETDGFIGEIATLVVESEAFDHLDYLIVRLTSENVPVSYAHVLEQGILLDVAKIKAAIYKMTRNDRDA